MALVVFDGMNQYASHFDFAREHLGWCAVNTTYGTGRYSGTAIRLNSASNHAAYRLNDDTETYTIGFHHQWNADNSHVICRIYERATIHLDLYYNGSGELQVRRGGSTVLGTSTGASLTNSTWYYIEFQFQVDNTTGLFEVKVDEADISLSGTSQDTRNVGNSGIVEHVLFLGSNTISTNDYDNLYILDSSGLTNNDFLGECVVETLFPTGDGTTNDFTPLSGLTNYEMVDNADPDPRTDYVSASVVADLDLFTTDGLQETVTSIFGVKVGYLAQLSSGAGVRTARSVIRSGATNYEGSIDQYVGPDWMTMYEIWETDPDTAAAWTESGVNNAEFGFTIQA